VFPVVVLAFASLSKSTNRKGEFVLQPAGTLPDHASEPHP
jgi:hypothetical protein